MSHLTSIVHKYTQEIILNGSNMFRLSLRPLTFRRLVHIEIPFKDDLVADDQDLFNLSEFNEYQESSQMQQFNLNLVNNNKEPDLSVVSKLNKPLVFKTTFTDPYLNLSFEDYIYNQMPIKDSNRLVFYKNTQCVVLGKNQNPWKELNLSSLNKQTEIPFIRRKSGGGTVVHDLGNMNYSFMTSKNNFNREFFGNVIVRGINEHFKTFQQGDKIRLNERGDITTVEGLKLSGSAYKLSKGKSYHHGTMLLDSDLDSLRKLLARDEKVSGKVESKSIDSVRSKVTNLHMEERLFVNCVMNGFNEVFNQNFVDVDGLHDNVYEVDEYDLLPEIIEAAEELKTWQWTYGMTPSFKHTFDRADHKVVFEVTKGLLKNVEIEADDNIKPQFEQIYLELKNSIVKDIKYNYESINEFIKDENTKKWLLEVI